MLACLSLVARLQGGTGGGEDEDEDEEGRNLSPSRFRTSRLAEEGKGRDETGRRGRFVDLGLDLLRHPAPIPPSQRRLLRAQMLESHPSHE